MTNPSIPFAADIAEALRWADSAIISKDMVPFNVVRMERQYAKVLAEAVRFYMAAHREWQDKYREIADCLYKDGVQIGTPEVWAKQLVADTKRAETQVAALKDRLAKVSVSGTISNARYTPAPSAPEPKR